MLATLFVSGAAREEAQGQFPPTGTSEFFDDEEEEEEEQDTRRMARDSARRADRRPLESYFFGSEVYVKEVFAWNASFDFNEVRVVRIDTMINNFQVNYPFFRPFVPNDTGSAIQGNLGGVGVPLNYFLRPHYYNFAFAQGWDGYNFFPGTVRFFNVKKPFTLFSYFTSGGISNYEEGFYITHAQNITPSTGFNIDYQSQGTRGFYAASRARVKNLSLAFNHTGKRYTVHAGYIYNTVQNRENGGIVSEASIIAEREELPQNIRMRLTDARNKLKNNTFYLVQSYGVPLQRLAAGENTIAGASSVFVGHSIQYTRWHKLYTDTRAGTIYLYPTPTETDPDATEPREFYRDWFFNQYATRDSIGESQLANRAFIQIQPFDRDAIVGTINAGVGMDIDKYYMLRPHDFITGSRRPETNTSLLVYGSVDGSFRRYFDWNADLVFHPTGHKSGELEVGGEAAMSVFVKDRPITLSGSARFTRCVPVYWNERLVSNHFLWSNSFDKETESRVSARLAIPSWHLYIGGAHSVVTNKVYYDEHAHPVSHAGAVNVTGLYADKEFRFGGFCLKHRVLLQWSTQQEVIPVPLASAYLSYFFEFDVVKGALRARLGVDCRYNTRYYAPGWMPATAVFFNQREREVGEYPLIDVFVSAKWKRMRILIKSEHFNENMFGIPRDYFSLWRYPLNGRVLKVGFSWAFYD